MSYIDPIVFSVPSPKKLDLAIYQLQLRIAELTWIQKVFGRAWMMQDYDGEGKQRVTTNDGNKPKLFTSATSSGMDANYIDALPNDELNSYSFFVVEGDETPIEYSPRGKNLFQREMSLIVWMRLPKVDPAKPYIFLEELSELVYAKLKLYGEKVQVTRYTDESAKVWAGLDWTNEENKNLRFPNMGFRIYFTLTYKESC